MPTRAVILKLVVPRSAEPDAVATRAALWRTHAEVNAATAYYERTLILLRGARYQTADAALGDDAARAALLDRARRVQAQNSVRLGMVAAPPPGADEEIVALLGDLYAAIVPTIRGANGTAQAANGYLSPLADPDSQGFLTVGQKLDRPVPDWLASLGEDGAACLNAATAWFESPASAAWRSDTGSPPAWLRKARVGDPAWPRLFGEKLAQLREDTRDGRAGLMGRLRALHLLPLFPAYFRGRITGSDAAVTPWDRLAFRLAVAHLLSWESWNRRAAAEHERRSAILAGFRAEHLTGDVPAALEALRVFERERSAHLSTLGLGASEYRLRGRQLRNWADLRERWLRSGSADPEVLMRIANAEQTRLRGRFGDPEVFAWLAAPAHQHVWRGRADAVSLLATLNAMEALVARSREVARLTLPDAVAHPRAVQWSAPGDTNLKPYRLGVDARGMCWATLRLLAPREDGGPEQDGASPVLFDHERTLLLAPSGQFHTPTFGTRDKKAVVTYRAAGFDTLSGVLGSADLLFDRPHLERRPTQALAAGDIGSVWLKLSLDLDPLPREGWTKDAARFVDHFRHAAGKTTGHEARVMPGARVLSVDLGVGTFAACSVFSLVDAEPADGRFAIALEVAGRAFRAVHERSFHLTLPDERVGREGDAWRREQTERLRRLRRALSRYRGILRLAELDAGGRVEAVQELRTAHAAGDPFAFEGGLLEDLAGRIGSPDPVWADAVAAALARFRVEMGGVVKRWRREGRARSAGRHSGPSMWAIQHLSDIRRLLLGWSLLGRRRGEIRRQDRAARGVFASRLLVHLDALKDERVKAGADLIVQAARGYRRDTAGRWQRAHPPCDLVLFEDLTRYRMATDRPRRENSRLMQWAHRAMPVEVGMQGELYGLAVADTGAAFSSRYHARSSTPGIRCRTLTKADFSDPFLRERLAADGFVLDGLRPGDLVPWEGGEVFVCQRAGGGLHRIDADVNAAQNLQRRFWTRHAEAFRIPCRVGRIAGRQVLVPRGFGPRLLGAMGGPGVLEPVGPDSPAFRWRALKPGELRKLGLIPAGGDVGGGEADSAEVEELQGLADQAAERSGQTEVLFRDPSGVVLPNDRWYPRKVFWGQIRSRLIRALCPAVGTAAQGG